MSRVVTVVLVLGTLVTFGTDILACGDKFLRIGHNARAGRYVAAYPASVLLYQAPGSAASLVKDLEKIVEAAGHEATSVTTAADARAAMASGRFDIVLAGPGEVSTGLTLTSSAGATPDLVPILYKPTKAELAAADRQYGCVIGVPADHKNRALAEIDCRMELRVKTSRRQ